MPTGPVPAVRAIVEDDHGRILLLQRAEGSMGGGQWCLPGGKVDYGQTVQEAMVREILEETALECTDAQFLFYQDSPSMTSGGMHCINLYFKCTVTGAIELNPESTAYAWAAPDQVTDYDIAFRNEEGIHQYRATQTPEETPSEE